MKLLLDANISWPLKDRLKQHFADCFHADAIGMDLPVTDADLWNYALAMNLIIVTNDDDFLNLANENGFPPKVVLLRTGNQSNGFIEALLIRHKPNIEALFASEEYGFLEIF
jgi:predicted nuclease of predicted toxin-antitoxin system